MRIRDTHILITGGSKGIGAALARQLHARGAKLTLLARPSKALKEVAEEVDGAQLPIDLMDLDNLDGAVTRAEEQNGPLDVLVNNAAIQLPVPFAELESAAMRGQMSANLLSPMELMRQALPGMIARDKGTIMNVSSLAGEFALPHLGCYSISKAGLTKSSLDLQRELKKTEIDVQLFLVGSVPGTQLTEVACADRVVKKLQKQFEAWPALTPEQVASSMVEDLERGGNKVRTLPRHAAPMTALRFLPVRIADLVFRKALD